MDGEWGQRQQSVQVQWNDVSDDWHCDCGCCGVRTEFVEECYYFHDIVLYVRDEVTVVPIRLHVRHGEQPHTADRRGHTARSLDAHEQVAGADS